MEIQSEGESGGVTPGSVDAGWQVSADLYEAATSGCGLAAAPPSSWLEIRGEDRARFLHGLVTCDIKGPAETDGSGAYGFFSDAKGRVLADLVASFEATRMLLELPSGADRQLAEHLSKFIVADRVELHPLGDRPVVAVVGRGAADVMNGLLGEVSREPWQHRTVEWAGRELLVRRDRRFGEPSWSICATGDDPGAPSELTAALIDAGALAVPVELLETLRLESGVPRFGVDFNSDHLPQETGLEEWAVSYTKGCYLGQEVVARVHYLGKPARLLRGALLDRQAAPGGTLSLPEGERAGTLTSCGFSPALGRWIGLTVLRRRAANEGVVLDHEDGGRAEVVALPFDQE